MTVSHETIYKSLYVQGRSELRGDGKRAEQVREAMAAKIVTLPEHLRRSITWDQGQEMSEHARFSVDTGVPVYFCDPRSPWQ